MAVMNTQALYELGDDIRTATARGWNDGSLHPGDKLVSKEYELEERLHALDSDELYFLIQRVNNIPLDPHIEHDGAHYKVSWDHPQAAYVVVPQ